MQAAKFFRSCIDAMICFVRPLGGAGSRLPRDNMETAPGQKFERQHRASQILESQDLFGATQALVGAGLSNAGRPKLAIRLMASLLYLKHMMMRIPAF
jgi:transposase, IS5 family